MICCMTCPWVSSLGPPVSSPVSSPSRPRRTLSPSAAFLVVPNHRFNMANVDCIRTFVRKDYPTGRRRTVASPVVPAPPDSVATVPPDSAAIVPPGSVATAAASYCLPSLRSFQHPPFRLLCSEMQANKMADVGRMSTQMCSKDRSL